MILADSNEVNYPTFEYMLRSVRSSCVSTSDMPAVSTIASSMSTATGGTTVAVGCAFFRYNYIRADAISSGLLSYANGQVHDAYDADGNWRNPYLARTLLAFSPYCNIVPTNVTYSFGNFFYTNQQVTSFEFNPGDGSGYHTLSTSGSSMTVTYSENTEYELKLRVTVGGSTYVAHSMVLAVTGDFDDIITKGQTSNVQPDTTFTKSTTYAGATVNAVVSIKYALNGDHKLRKPYIIAEGFDVDSLTLSLLDIKKTYLGYNYINNFYRSDLFYADSIKNNYDIVYIDWLNSEADIKANAQLLEDIINKVNSIKVGSGRNVLMGYSMGGLIARYALRSMENAGVEHQVSTYVSYDAPHLGVNIPLGAFYAANDLLYNFGALGLSTYQIFDMIGKTLSLFGNHTCSDYLSMARKYLGSKSVRQMVVNYVDPTGTLDNSEHTAWQSELNAIGFPKGDHGKGILNLAISNGGLNEKNSSIPFIEAHGDISVVWWADLLLWLGDNVIARACPLTMLNSFIIRASLIGSSRFEASLYAYPYTGNNQTVYSADINYIKKFLWLSNLNTTLYSSEKKSPISGTPMDIINGSYYDLDMKGKSHIPTTTSITSYDTVRYSLDVDTTFMFVPTASALCVGGGTSSLSTAVYNSTSFSANDTPFDAVLYDSSNTWSYHTSVIPNVFDWILDHVRVEIGGPLSPYDGAQYTVEDWGGNVAWSTSDSSVATMDVDGHINILSTGFVTIYAIINVDGNPLTLEKRVMTGIPSFSLSELTNRLSPFRKVMATCSDSEFYDFFDLTAGVYYWGVKTNDGPISWQSSASRLLFLEDTYACRIVYFRAENESRVGQTYSIILQGSLLPDEPILVNSDSTLYAAGSDSTYVAVKSEVEDSTRTSTYCIDGKITISFNHVPTSFELCKRLMDDDSFKDGYLHRLKPWGDEDVLILKITVSTSDDTVSETGTLKFIYKENFPEL